MNSINQFQTASTRLFEGDLSSEVFEGKIFFSTPKRLVPKRKTLDTTWMSRRFRNNCNIENNDHSAILNFSSSRFKQSAVKKTSTPVKQRASVRLPMKNKSETSLKQELKRLQSLVAQKNSEIKNLQHQNNRLVNRIDNLNSQTSQLSRIIDANSKTISLQADAIKTFAENRTPCLLCCSCKELKQTSNNEFTVISPCGHVVCENCSNGQLGDLKCPSCRTQIYGRMPLTL